VSTVGFTTFDKNTLNLTFIVKNVSNKVIKIFGQKINIGQEYNLMDIPTVSEADIKHSLTKGELKTKLNNNDVSIVENTLNLIQFKKDFIAFLTENGLSIGVVNEGNVVIVTEDFIATIEDIILVNSNDGYTTITLPDATLYENVNRKIIIKKIAADDTNIISIVPISGQTIDLSLSKEIYLSMTSLSLIAANNNWWIL